MQYVGAAEGLYGLYQQGQQAHHAQSLQNQALELQREGLNSQTPFNQARGEGVAQLLHMLGLNVPDSLSSFISDPNSVMNPGAAAKARAAQQSTAASDYTHNPLGHPPAGYSDYKDAQGHMHRYTTGHGPTNMQVVKDGPAATATPGGGTTGGPPQGGTGAPGAGTPAAGGYDYNAGLQPIKDMVLGHDYQADTDKAIAQANKQTGLVLDNSLNNVRSAYAQQGGNPGGSSEYYVKMRSAAEDATNPLWQFAAQQQAGQRAHQLGDLQSLAGLESTAHEQQMGDIGMLLGTAPGNLASNYFQAAQLTGSSAPANFQPNYGPSLQALQQGMSNIFKPNPTHLQTQSSPAQSYYGSDGTNAFDQLRANTGFGW